MPLTYVANPASSFATIGNTLAWRRAGKGGMPLTYTETANKSFANERDPIAGASGKQAGTPTAYEVAPPPFATPLSSNRPRSARSARDEERNTGTPP